MVVACLFGAAAQFYPLPFPDNRVLLFVCVIVYFGLSGVLQYFTSFADRDCIWQSRRSAVRRLAPSEAWGDEAPVVARLPRLRATALWAAAAV